MSVNVLNDIYHGPEVLKNQDIENLQKELDEIRKQDLSKLEKQEKDEEIVLFCVNIDMAFSVLILLELFDIALYIVSMITMLSTGGAENEKGLFDMKDGEARPL